MWPVPTPRSCSSPAWGVAQPAAEWAVVARAAAWAVAARPVAWAVAARPVAWAGAARLAAEWGAVQPAAGCLVLPRRALGRMAAATGPGIARSPLITPTSAPPRPGMLLCGASLASLELASRRCALLLRRRAEPGSDQVEGGTGLGGARRVTDPTREPCPWVGSRNSARFRPGS